MSAFSSQPRSSRYRLAGGHVVTPHAELPGADVVIHGSLIAAIGDEGEGYATPDEVVIDARGSIVIPGLIDIHADYIEHMAAPRPTSMLDFRFALRQSERELITHGITTMFHSLAFYAHDAFSQSPIRAPQHTERLIELIEASHASEHLIRHRCHARYEIDNFARVAELERYIRSGRVHLLSFMDHTPGQGQYRDLAIFRKTLLGYRQYDEADLDRIVAEAQARAKLSADEVAALVALAHEHGLAVASHDDDSVARVQAQHALGMSISEFPITLEVARAARALGLHAVAGAPNVLLGGSHSGNLSAAEAIVEGAVDVLCSDYYPAALLKSLFTLYDRFAVPLPQAVSLATSAAAAAVRIDHEVGSLAVGKRADVLLIRRLADGTPVVARAFVDGAAVLAMEYRS
jgi:alpha-D-ribose 1-methylphosphonate 5-triphosphate diphosphatase